MRGISAWTTSTLLTVAALVTAHGEPNLKHEHAGDVFRKLHRKQCYLDGPASNGSSLGEYRTVDGVDLYIAHPPSRHHKKTKTTPPAIIYLTDIFGVQLLNNRLLADAFSKAGYLTIIPDLFRGDPVPANALSNPNSNFNISEWQTRHPASEIESIITSTFQTTVSEYGIPTSKIGAVGYCFGGKYVAKYLSSNSTRGNLTFAAGFTAHPSNTLPSEWEAIENPISIAFGELDASSTPENRTNIEGIFIEGNKTFQTNLYADAEHGFAVRTNLTDPKKRFAQESAYLQAVRWFDQWVKEDEDDE
ncbi:hypothetical protein CKM354_000695300 [Cercospora kikuchii]|uniref:Dienelactone hydrolase domain-containing protein n=1 Tax=Cercospora kikuchii TaxID=84275 RepID=A0A9P3CJ76_9PEZI|nr:uncharacterized protein CKM354_000695300 [Cercospora kikuchii]GIZ43736.1 hypothetical protein CKM354_000695300 [Cercospora kikuchii]